MSSQQGPSSRRTAVTATLLAVVVTGAAITTVALGATGGPFTKQQAEDGHIKFNTRCAECHRPDLTGALGPSLVDDKFRQKWAGKPVADLRDWIHTNMPQNAPGTLPDDWLDPIVAWILLKDGVQPGDKPLSKDTASATFPKG